MNKISNKELVSIVGGISISGSLVNAISRGMGVLLDLGRSFGSAIRRGWSGRVCPL